jgi:hypothetical protein
MLSVQNKYFILRVIMLNVVMLNVVKLNVVKLNVVMLNVIMMSVVETEKTQDWIERDKHTSLLRNNINYCCKK